MQPPKLGEREKDACYMMSDIFLDNELSDWDLNSMARYLRGLNVPMTTLNYILRYDLFPLLYGNLLCLPGGVWMGFDRTWLLTSIEERRGSGMIKRLVHQICSSIAWAVMGNWVLGHWSIIQERMQQNQ